MFLSPLISEIETLNSSTQVRYDVMFLSEPIIFAERARVDTAECEGRTDRQDRRVRPEIEASGAGSGEVQDSRRYRESDAWTG